MNPPINMSISTIALNAIAGATLSVFAVVPAAAEEIRVVVPYGDLDTSTPVGAETLAQRLAAGIDTVCERPATRDLKALATWHSCREQAARSVSEQLSGSGLAALVAAN